MEQLKTLAFRKLVYLDLSWFHESNDYMTEFNYLVVQFI